MSNLLGGSIDGYILLDNNITLAYPIIIVNFDQELKHLFNKPRANALK